MNNRSTNFRQQASGTPAMRGNRLAQSHDRAAAAVLPAGAADTVDRILALHRAGQIIRIHHDAFGNHWASARTSRWFNARSQRVELTRSDFFRLEKMLPG